MAPGKAAKALISEAPGMDDEGVSTGAAKSAFDGFITLKKPLVAGENMHNFG